MISEMLAVASWSQAAPADEALFSMVEIEVSGDPTYTISHSIAVYVTRQDYARSADDLKQRRWTAVRKSERGEQTVTSDDCPRLDLVVRDFTALPSLSPANTLAFAERGKTATPPMMLHGFPTRVRWKTVDGTIVETVGGYWHRKWAHDTVRDLMECWAPLIPEGSTGLPQ